MNRRHLRSRFRKRIRNFFDQEIATNYSEAVFDRLRAENLTRGKVMSGIGVVYSTVWRWFEGRVMLRFDHFISILHVFGIRPADVPFPERRQAVRDAMIRTLRELQREVSPHSPNEMTEEVWTALRAVFLSEDWRQACKERSKGVRLARLDSLANQLLDALHMTLKPPAHEAGWLIREPSDLHLLVKHWMPSWCCFFACIPYRWKF